MYTVKKRKLILGNNSNKSSWENMPAPVAADLDLHIYFAF